MPRIRKKTSKRGTTHQRARIKHKAAEGRRKKKKEAKKNPQWKSNKKKDPGIPNEFPYKDQILAEVAQSRREAEEAKRRRKEEKKAAREGAQDEADAAPAEESAPAPPAADDDAPLLLSPDLPNLKAVLDKADVVLHVLDARDPLSFRLPHIEEVVSANASSHLVFVLTKIDLVPRENAAAWAAHLRAQHPTFLFRAASAFLPQLPAHATPKGKAPAPATDALGAAALLAYLAQREARNVAVVGVTNTGKSALINSLARTAAVPVYTATPSADARSTTTTRTLEVPLGTARTLLDTPGAALLRAPGAAADADAHRVRDTLLRSRGRPDRLKDPLPAAAHIVARARAADLMAHYALPAFAAGDAPAFLAALARAGRVPLKKGGVPDAAQAARGVLRDWAAGRLPYCVDPPSPAVEGAASADEEVLAALKTRREMRRGAGLVWLAPGEVETRRVDMESMYVVEGAESVADAEEEAVQEEDEEEEEDDDNDDDEEDGDDDEDDEDDDDDDDAPAAPVPGKRKRAAGKTAARPSKKVAFAAGTLDRAERKEARGAAKAALKPAKAALKSSQAATKQPAKTPPAASKPPPKTRQAATANPPPPASDSDAYDFGQFFK